MAGQSCCDQPRRADELLIHLLRRGHDMETYERLKKLVESASEDVAKAEGGNKAAGTRVRKIMQDVKAAAQDLRNAVLEARKDD
jgi:hypothetical protein